MVFISDKSFLYFLLYLPKNTANLIISMRSFALFAKNISALAYFFARKQADGISLSL
jgi:hypothetical protein